MSTTKLQEENQTISKTQIKREMTALQNLGKKLTQISQGLLDKCQLPDELLSAIMEHKRLPNKNEAKRRHLQFIGKIMRKVDTSQIEKVLNQSKQNIELEKRKFLKLEHLREALIAGNTDALNTLIIEQPAMDIQHLRQLIRQSQKELAQNKSPTASRKLFKYLREVVLESGK